MAALGGGRGGEGGLGGCSMTLVYVYKFSLIACVSSVVKLFM